MAHSKKSRKIGKIGVSKTDKPREQKKPLPSKSKKSGLGNKAGTRQQAGLPSSSRKTEKSKQDPRIGSKKAIDLNKYQEKGQAGQQKPRFLSPQQELDAIEQDSKLERLLSKQETKALTKMEKSYLDKTLARHRELCAMLGIEIDSTEDDSDTEIDPFAQLDAIRLDDYKD